MKTHKTGTLLQIKKHFKCKRICDIHVCDINHTFYNLNKSSLFIVVSFDKDRDRYRLYDIIEMRQSYWLFDMANEHFEKVRF